MAMMAGAAPLSLPSLRLPNPRISINFGDFAIEQNPLATSRDYLQSYLPEPDNSVIPGNRIDHFRTRLPSSGNPEAQKASRTTNFSRVLTFSKQHVEARQTQKEASSAPKFLLYRSNSESSTKSSTSATSTNVSSVFSSAGSVSSTGTSHSVFHPSVYMGNQIRKPHRFHELPQPILEHILAYVLGGPWVVSLRPQQPRSWPEQHRQNRTDLDHIDIRLIMMHPIFRISHNLRKLALDVFHRDSKFVIDLFGNNTRSTNSDNEKDRKFWTTHTPNMLKDALGAISNLQIRVPVPSTEAVVARGVKYHVPLDEQFGTNWRVQNMKSEQQDIVALQNCLRGITNHIVNSNVTVSKVRSRSNSLRRSGSLRRLRSFRSSKDPTDSLEFTCCGEDSRPISQRQPLKRLDIILVKRSASSVILPETLELLHTWTSIPVAGWTGYSLELDGRKRLWAAQRLGSWLGSEPDGAKLLHDLQNLKMRFAPQVISTQPASQIDVLQIGQRERLPPQATDVPHSTYLEKLDQIEEEVRRKAIHQVGNQVLSQPSQPSKVDQKQPQSQGIKPSVAKKKEKENEKKKRANGLEWMLGGTVIRKKAEPPSIEELQKIAEDVRQGLY